MVKEILDLIQLVESDGFAETDRFTEQQVREAFSGAEIPVETWTQGDRISVRLIGFE